MQIQTLNFQMGISKEVKLSYYWILLLHSQDTEISLLVFRKTSFDIFLFVLDLVLQKLMSVFYEYVISTDRIEILRQVSSV